MSLLCSFGLLTDVQAAAKPTSSEPDGRLKRYDEAVELLGQAIDVYNDAHAQQPLALVLHCGDVSCTTDGQPLAGLLLASCHHAV